MLLRDPGVGDGALGMHGEQADGVVHLLALLADVALEGARVVVLVEDEEVVLVRGGDLLVLAVVDALEPLGPALVALCGVLGEDGGVLGLDLLPGEVVVDAEVVDEVNLLDGVFYVAAGAGGRAAGAAGGRGAAGAENHGEAVREATADDGGREGVAVMLVLACCWGGEGVWVGHRRDGHAVGGWAGDVDAGFWKGVDGLEGGPTRTRQGGHEGC